MIEIYKTIDGRVAKIEEFEKNCWINMTRPTKDEIDTISQQYGVEEDYIRAALDNEEISRVEQDEDYNCSLITFDVPRRMEDSEELTYETYPIGIIETPVCVITVCLHQNEILEDFARGKVKYTFTNLKTRFILQILYRAATRFLYFLRTINKRSTEVEMELHRSMKNKELFQMLELEKSLVFFSTSLKSNQMVIEKLQRGRIIKLYEDDVELLEDVMIEVDQAIEMCSIYSNILSGEMDAFASIISNNLNIVMKILTAITILMAIPTMVSSFYGMNVAGLPFASFGPVVTITVVLTALVALVLYKFHMFS
ncbi:MAG: magnesium transporter CorA family protein [Eubacteriaceae bacterium]|jgi:magnesium transporter